jgi:hypothetical protein
MSSSETFNQHVGAAKALWEFQDELNRLGYDFDHPSPDVKRINDLAGDAALRFAGYVDAIACEKGIRKNEGLS